MAKKKKKISGLKWYTFDQNNSGGSFDTKFGKEVIIQANSADEADDIASDLGIYFNGVENESDCPCCGDRWYRASDWDSCDVPAINKVPIVDCSTKFCFYDKDWKDGKAIQIVPYGKPPFFVERGKSFNF